MKVFALLAALVLAQARPPVDVTGVWQWQGSAGWQRLEMTLKADGSRVSGAVRMGPGSREPQSPSEFWEYFFDAADFRISNGRIAGNTITFEHSASRGTNAPAGGFGAQSTRTSPVRFTYRGIIQGDQIQMTRQVEFDDKDPWALGSHRVEFLLQRVK
jgi:hypothetical protein